MSYTKHKKRQYKPLSELVLRLKMMKLLQNHANGMIKRKTSKFMRKAVTINNG